MDEHAGAFEYDWRTRFRLPLTVAGTSRMRWPEVWRLFEQLAEDPSSHVGAALQGWTYPASRELLALSDLYDLTTAVNVDTRRGQPQKYLRPWPAPGTTRVGRSTLTTEETKELLATRFGRPDTTPPVQHPESSP